VFNDRRAVHNVEVAVRKRKPPRLVDNDWGEPIPAGALGDRVAVDVGDVDVGWRDTRAC
jgi:hypothetical protein